MVGFIYKIANDFNDKVYIGYTNNTIRRKSEHFSPCQFKRKTRLYNSIRKYGVENFYFEVIYCSIDEWHCLSVMEPLFIIQYDAYNKGYNSTHGGEKQVFTEEVKAKISASKLGHIVTKETREKLSQYAIKQFQDINMIERLSRAKRKKWKVIFPNGNEIITQNLIQFCKENNLKYNSIANCASTKSTCYGIKCLKLED